MMTTRSEFIQRESDYILKEAKRLKVEENLQMEAALKVACTAVLSDKLADIYTGMPS